MKLKLIPAIITSTTMIFALPNALSAQGYNTSDLPSTAPAVSTPSRPSFGNRQQSMPLVPMGPPMGTQILSMKCGTPVGSCFIGQVGTVGTTCWCNSMTGQIFYGQLMP